jgi:peptidoglycan/xylan/chitin deacetylase (PgdA/CDA1 family)
MTLTSGVRAIAVATRGKGVHRAVRRARTIQDHYGFLTSRMGNHLTRVLDLVAPYEFAATLPIPAVVLSRYPRVVNRYANVGIEFAVHGHSHVDHSRLTLPEQIRALTRARAVFEHCEVEAHGYRAPYLRWNDATIAALAECGFLYDGSQAIACPVGVSAPTDSYERALSFTGALSAATHPIVPSIDRGVVRIPYVLPDDEAMVERLERDESSIARAWLEILEWTHARGELFTLAVHPERVEPCVQGLRAVLERARKLQPRVWIARHSDLARWWLDRAAAVTTVSEEPAGSFRLRVHSPEQATILVKGLDAPSAEDWTDGYSIVAGSEVGVRCTRRPFVGLHPASDPRVACFLREQGFIVEASDSPARYWRYVHRPTFEPSQGRALLDELERSDAPLVRLARWPLGARSALAVTGDVDALTIRDYAFRLVGR